MLEYTLYNNHFTADNPDDRLARPVNVPINTREDLIDDITSPGSILKPTETNAVIDNYWQRITGYIRDGEAYRDDYIRTRFGISGVFQNDEDQYDPARHQVLISIVPKDSVTDAADDINLQKVDGQAIRPEVETIYDWGSGTDDDILTPGGVLEIKGTHLKIHNNIEEEGVFFVNQADSTETAATHIRTSEPKTLTLQVPEGLTAGTYRIEVRNTTYNSDSLRTGLFAPELTVE
ncbi:DUF4469 domain-containing protein [Fodinibius salsisoli]|uniref:DUF4469 domain-containing protein n=1 Tax=Fodinibius salsisoli TaxID=2820877 RepID=A0ABT3PI69_9BACT|nr:DUF4469 domain-containing protein [Fodinibius salsisoli]MCW9705612.1 DUF4469 domain-containing protein [Fodinibius salsisoli]